MLESQGYLLYIYVALGVYLSINIVKNDKQRGYKQYTILVVTVMARSIIIIMLISCSRDGTRSNL